jgi:hypothetical protein
MSVREYDRWYKIYLVVYALIVLTLIRAILAYKATADEGPDVVKAVAATDRKLLGLLILVFVVAVAAILMLR